MLAPLLSMLISIGGPASAEKDISALLSPIREKHGVPALAGAIVDSRGATALGAVGLRRKGGKEPVTTGDLWHIGSCTKSMTATVLARLVEDEKLSWGLTLADAFPELKKRMHPQYGNVTLEQLLRHRGGTPSKLTSLALWSQLWNHQGSPTEQRWTLIEGILTRPPETPPGEKSVYSNAGYAIAGAIAERATRTPWEELIRRELFQPLKMSSTGFGAPGVAGAVTQPRGHRGGIEKATPVEPGPRADNPPAMGPAGRVHCSLSDWAKYISLHIRKGRGEDELLKPTSFEKLHSTLDRDDYALGWMVTRRSWGGGRVLTHSGSNTMWYAVVRIAPRREFAVLATSNVGGAAAAKACDQVASTLIRHHLQSSQESTPR